MARFTTIEIRKEYLHFSAAHFTVFSATERERLHGHNWRIGALITGPVGDDGLCFDYDIKGKAYYFYFSLIYKLLFCILFMMLIVFLIRKRKLFYSFVCFEKRKILSFRGLNIPIFLLNFALCK